MNLRQRVTLRKTFSFSLLAILLFCQTYWFLSSSLPLLHDVWKIKGQPAIWRSARRAYGETFADFVLFLHAQVPETATVVLPPAGTGPKGLTNTAAMQFFLQPRTVINCTSLNCKAAISGDHYVITVDGFPPAEQPDNPTTHQVMFNSHWGVVFPSQSNNKPGGQALLPFTNMWQILQKAIPPLTWFLLFSISGLVLWTLFLPNLPLLSRLALGTGFILGAYSFTLYLLSFFFTNLPFKALAWITTGTMLGVSGAFSLHLIRNPQYASRFTIAKTDFFWSSLILSLGIVIAIIAIGEGYHAGDAITIWGAKGYAIASGGVRAAASQGLQRDYPLNIPVLIASFRALFGDALPESKILFPFFYTALMLQVFVFLRKYSSHTFAGLTTLLLATTPLIIRHALIGYTNLPAAYYLSTATLLLLWPIPSALRYRRDILGGSFLALAAWTRPEGTLLALFLITLYLLSGWNKTEQESSSWLLIAPWIGYVLLWKSTAPRIYSHASVLSHYFLPAMHGLLQGSIHFQEGKYLITTFLQQVFSSKYWFGLGWSITWFAVAQVIVRHRPSTSAKPLLLIGAGLIGAILSMYYVTSYSNTYDISFWVMTGMARMLIPGIILFWLGITTSWGQVLYPTAHEESAP